MVYYTVTDLAEALGTNPETIRRWVRGEKLAAEKAPKKDGFKISDEAIRDFFIKNPKYARQAESSPTFSRIAKEAAGQAIIEKSLVDIGAIKINEADSWLAAARAQLAEKEREVEKLRSNIKVLETILTVWRQGKEEENYNESL